MREGIMQISMADLIGAVSQGVLPAEEAIAMLNESGLSPRQLETARAQLMNGIKVGPPEMQGPRQLPRPGQTNFVGPLEPQGPKQLPQPGSSRFVGPIQPYGPPEFVGPKQLPQPGSPNFVGPLEQQGPKQLPRPGHPNFIGPLEQYGPPKPIPQPGQPNFVGPIEPYGPKQPYGPPSPDKVIGPFLEGQQPKGFNVEDAAKGAGKAGVSQLGRYLGMARYGTGAGAAAAVMAPTPVANGEIPFEQRLRENQGKLPVSPEQRKMMMNPQIQQSLREMDESELLDLLAHKPELMTPEKWQGTPEMYAQYLARRQELGLPNNPEKVQEQKKVVVDPVTNKPIPAASGDRPQTAPEDVTFSPSAVSPYANIQRIDETQPVSVVEKQKDTRTGQLTQMLQDIKRNLGNGAFDKDVDVNMYDSKAEKTLSPSQYADLQAKKAKIQKTIDFYNDPKVTEELMANPALLIRAAADPYAIRDELYTTEGNPSELGGKTSFVTPKMGGSSKVVSPTPAPSPEGVAGVAGKVVAPNPIQSSVGGGNEFGMGNEIRGEEPEIASVRAMAANAPKEAQITPRVSVTAAPYRVPTNAIDSLTRKAYAPIGQKEESTGVFNRIFNNKDAQNRIDNYQKDSSLYRSGPNGEESATDFVMNAPIYQKRLAEQPSAEARGGQIRGNGNPQDAICHTGIIHMAVGGRTDHLPMHVKANSYVLPADVVSGMGEGNTLAGGRIIDKMFSGEFLQRLANKGAPHKAGGGELTDSRSLLERRMMQPGQINTAQGPVFKAQEMEQVKVPGIDFNLGPYNSKPEQIRPSNINYPSPKYNWHYSEEQSNKDYGIPKSAAARGGFMKSNSEPPVPIVAAGGEYVIDPQVVYILGHGNMDAGHKWLDNFVKSTRAHTIKTMQNLPGPKKD